MTGHDFEETFLTCFTLPRALKKGNSSRFKPLINTVKNYNKCMTQMLPAHRVKLKLKLVQVKQIFLLGCEKPYDIRYLTKRKEIP